VIWNWESQFPAHPVASKDGHSSESGRKIKLQCLCFWKISLLLLKHTVRL